MESTSIGEFLLGAAIVAGFAYFLYVRFVKGKTHSGGGNSGGSGGGRDIK